MAKGQETVEGASGVCRPRTRTPIGVQYVNFEVEQHTQKSQSEICPLDYSLYDYLCNMIMQV